MSKYAKNDDGQFDNSIGQMSRLEGHQILMKIQNLVRKSDFVFAKFQI